MRTTVIRPSSLTTTRLGFGCAHLLRLPARRSRQAVLEAAFDHGIRHFDVARSYGLGAAESELGRFARGRRDELVLATKFGIEPGVAGRFAAAQGPARAALQHLPALRRRVKRAAGDATSGPPRVYDGAGARRSLETSLRALGTDHVDLLFLHEPGARDEVRTADVCGALDDARDRGLIRAWGISGDPGPTLAVAERLPAPVVLQLRDDVLARPTPGSPALVFGVLQDALETILAHTAADADRRRRWGSAVGVDCGDAEALAALLLREALDAHPDATVLFSTTQPARAAAAARAADDAERGGPDDLRAFRELVAAELLPVAAGAG
jgi:hypothetical protein